MISGFGLMYPVVCTYKGALFADKIDAVIKKNIARHLYDIIFMVAHKFPIDRKVLKSLGLGDNPLSLIEKRVKEFTEKEIKNMAESLKPFLFDEKEVELVLKAKEIIPQLLKKYKPS